MNVVYFFFNSRNKLNSAVIVPPLINFKCSPTLGTLCVQTWNTWFHFIENLEKVSIEEGIDPLSCMLSDLKDDLINILGTMWVQIWNIYFNHKCAS